MAPKWLRDWWPALAWSALIWTFSGSGFGESQTAKLIIPVLRWLFADASTATIWMYHGWIRKAGHFVEYFVLSLLLLRGLRAGRPGWRLGWCLLAVAIAAAYAAVDEFHQAFEPGRGPSSGDVLIDCTGAITAQVLITLRARARSKGNAES